MTTVPYNSYLQPINTTSMYNVTNTLCTDGNTLQVHIPGISYTPLYFILEVYYNQVRMLHP